MEAVVLFIIAVGLIMTGVLALLLIYLAFRAIKELIRLIKLKKRNKFYKKFIRKYINIKFKKQMRELREPQVYKEVISDKKSENFKYPVCF